MLLRQRGHDALSTYEAGIVSPQFQRNGVGELLRQMLNLLNNVTADEMWNTIRYLQNYR